MIGYTACIKRDNGTRFANGGFYLYSAPFETRQQAQDWAAAFDDCHLTHVTRNNFMPNNIIRSTTDGTDV